jgi:hypothetical protein
MKRDVFNMSPHCDARTLTRGHRAERREKSNKNMRNNNN